MSGIHKSVIVAAQYIVDGLADIEVAVLHLALSFGEPEPHHIGYDKIGPLLTEAGGTRMHTDTRAAFVAALERRISAMPR